MRKSPGDKITAGKITARDLVAEDQPIREEERALVCRVHPDDGVHVLWDPTTSGVRVMCGECERTLVYLVAQERVH